MPDLTGQILGKYRIVRMLGSGGMGTVYLAEQATFQRTVALKVVTSENLRSPDAVRRFRREIQAAARLEHPNIVAAYDADEVDGVCFLVMEYVEGRDLRGLVTEAGPLPVAQAIDYTRQTAAGLAYAHARGIIHRDIKPANLLLGPGGTVKILDMGLALVQSADIHDSDAPAMSELTHTGAVMGTVDYMSPEQALDTHATDARGDVYSLGCTLCFLLTGKAPYRGSTLMARMLAHREGAIPSLAAARADVSPRLDAVFQRMIAKAPDDRFQTMDDLLAALRQVASPPGDGWRDPASVAALNGGPLTQADTAGSGAALSSGADLTAAEPFELHSQRHHQKTNPAVIVAAAGLVSALAIGGYFLMDRSPKGRLTTKAPATSAAPRPAPTRAAPAAEPEEASDRPIAEWVLQAGGSIELQLGEGTFTPLSIAELPLAPFRLTRVTINGHRYAAGDLERLADLPELTYLELSGSWQGPALVPDSDLKFVQRLPRLESIVLNFLTISDGSLAHLAKLDRLTSVSLYHTGGIGDDGIAHLRGLHRLHSLHLGGTSVTDAVFEILEGMPELENLLLDDTRITGTGMTHLFPAKKLQWIHLANSQFNDAGLAALANITWLTTLSIPNTQVTDAGLKSLVALVHLETLDMTTMPRITDAGIAHLAGMKELRRLALNGDGVTDAGVAALQARLPDCRIER